MARLPFRDRLHRGAIPLDGALGTLLYARGVPYERGFDELNIARPDLIEGIHREYLAAGAEVIESNTFGANRLRLAVLGQDSRAAELNAAGVRLAVRARADVLPDAYVAGAIGPVGQPLEPIGAVSLGEARAAFAEQAATLAEAGADLLILETFSDLRELREAILAARGACDLPLVAQMSFTAEGRTPTGETPEEVARTLEALAVDVLGVNCGVGPQVALDVTASMAAVSQTPLVAQPNAGFPGRVGGRIFYLSTPQYLADYARRFVAAGVTLVGGCCGTTPEHVQAMSRALVVEPAHATRVTLPRVPAGSPAGGPERRPDRTRLQRGLSDGAFVVSLEIEPPASGRLDAQLAIAGDAVEAGVSCVNVPEPPTPRGRASGLAVAARLLERGDLDVILHCTTRDRNLIALQAEVLGAHALGVRNVLAVTGDPLRVAHYPHAAGVWDVDAIGLIEILARMNRGEDHAGSPLDEATAFHIGCTISVAGDPSLAVDRLHRKIEAGAHFVMAPPLFDDEQLAELRATLGALPVPLLVGVLPLHGTRHAEFLHNEVPGVVVPAAIRERLRAIGADGADEGLRLAGEFLRAASRQVNGVYLVAPTDRLAPALALVAGLASARNTPA